MTKYDTIRSSFFRSAMRSTQILAVAGLVALMSACKLEELINGEQGAAPSGTRAVHTLTVENLAREFIVYKPLSASETNAPAVFMLHGTGGDGERYYNHSGWREKADKEGLIAIFPSALKHCFFEDDNRDGDFDDAGEKKVTEKWAHGALGDPAEMPLCTPDQIAQLSQSNQTLVDHPLADDLGFFDAMLEFLVTNYSIDSNRVYVSGFSNGGQMAGRLAVERANEFAAVAAHASSLKVSGPTERPIAMVLSVGNMDDRFLPDDGSLTALPMEESIAEHPFYQEIVSPFLDAFQLTDTHSFEEGWAECIEQNCTVHADQTQCVDSSNCRKVIKFTYTQSEVGASNRLHVLLADQLTHEYPNGSNHPVIMAEYLWEEFFKTKSLP